MAHYPKIFDFTGNPIDSCEIAWGTGTGITSSNYFVFDCSRINLVMGGTQSLNGATGGVYLSSIIGGHDNRLYGACNSAIIAAKNSNMCGQFDYYENRYSTIYNSIITGECNLMYSYFDPICNSAIIGGRRNSILSSQSGTVILGGIYNTASNYSDRSLIGSSKNSIVLASIESTILGTCDSCIKSSVQSTIISALCSYIGSISYGGFLKERASIIASSNGYIGATFGSSTDNIILSSTKCNLNPSIRNRIGAGCGNSIVSSYRVKIGDCSVTNHSVIISSCQSYIENSSSSLILGSATGSCIALSNSSIISGSRLSDITSSTSSTILSSFCSYIDNSLRSVLMSGSGSSILSSENSAIIGGKGLTLSSENDVVYLSTLKLNLATQSVDELRILTWDPDNYVRYTTSVSGNTPIDRCEIAWGTGTGITSSDYFLFDCSCINLVMGGVTQSGIVNSATNSVFFSSILGGQLNTLSNLTASSILGSLNSTITASCYSAIIGGTSNSISVSNDSGILASDCSSICRSRLSTIISSCQTGITGSSNSVAIGGNCNCICRSNCSSIISSYKSCVTSSGQSAIIGSSQSCIMPGTGQSLANFLAGGNSWYVDASCNSVVIGGYCGCVFTSKSSMILVSSTSSIFRGKFSSIIGSTWSCISQSTYTTILTANRSSICSATHSNIIGGTENTICVSSFTGILGGRLQSITQSNYSTIISGCSNRIYNSKNSLILGGGNSCIVNQSYRSLLFGCSSIIDAQSKDSMILGGSNNCICNGSFNSSIISGCLNVIINDVCDSIIIQGCDNCLVRCGNKNSIINSDCSILDCSCSSTIISSYKSCTLCTQHSSIISSSQSCVIGSSTRQVKGSLVHGGHTQFIATSSYSGIIGGFCNIILNATSSAIIGGSGSTICGSRNSAIIGGIGLTLSNENQVVFIPELKINKVDQCLTLTKFLAWDDTNKYVRWGTPGLDNGITGSTIYYTGSFWTYSSTNIYNNGTYVGIGITNSNTNTYATPSSNLHVFGSLSLDVKTASSNYTLTDRNFTLIAYAPATGGMTVSLPSASLAKHRLYVIKKADAFTQSFVYISPSGANTIEGYNGSITLENQWDYNILQSDGVSMWIKLGGAVGLNL